MIQRQWRMLRIVAVAEEYRAALTAAEMLGVVLRANPTYGDQQGWRQRAGQDFIDNLEATYIVRMYAEFEAGLRDYWKSYLGRDTHPTMVQLLNEAIPNQRFPRDWIDNADAVREYRNFLVHEIEEEPPRGMETFTVEEAKRFLCAYFSCLDPNWR
jgi:hypothetical protein